MDLSSLQHGKIELIQAIPLTGVGVDQLPPNRNELALTTVGDVCAVVLPARKEPVLLDGADHGDQRELRRMAEQDAPRLCWLVGVRKRNRQVDSLTIQVHEFSARMYLPEVIIGVDEKLLSDMERHLGRRFSMNAACAWLAEFLLLAPAADGGQSRALLIGRPENQPKAKEAFRILGSRYALGVKRDAEGRWMGVRLTPSRIAVTLEEYRPIHLAEGGFAFTDATVAGQVRQGMATELDQMVRSAGSYLGVWSEYQRMEEKRLMEDARRFGWLSYDGRHRSPDGCWSFQLSAESEWTSSQLRQGASGETQLEAAAEVPDALTSNADANRPEPTSTSSRQEDSRPAFRGKFAGANRGSVRLRPTSQDTETEPPEHGYIYISLRGDLARIRRRREAHERIAKAKTSIPQLLLLLENRPVPVRRMQAMEPLSAAAKAKFRNSSPTPRQVEAIRVALNTPDIAVIQGPPGTGKTRTIAAIVERLTENSKKENALFERVLLTSFQHDAVENVAAMTEIRGLPAMKIGRRSGDQSEDLTVQMWGQRIAAALEADLAGSPEMPLRKLLETVRVRHAAYVQSPGTDAEAARMLLELRDLARPHLPAVLLDRIASVVERLRLGNAGLDADREYAVVAARSLRVLPDAFMDDGPRMAWRALERLSSGPWLTADDRALLEKAKDWQSGNPPGFLPEVEALRDRLLDALQTEAPPSRTPLVNAEVVDVLDQMSSTVENLARRSVREGANLALEQLMQDLKTDPHGLRDVIERYTVVLAATCQQAVSNRMMDLLDDDIEFENVIVDEAARANPLDLLIPMSRAARRIILVGDHRQLPHLLEPEVERELEKSVSEETRVHIRQSLFERLFLHVKSLEAQDGIKRWVTLDTQYRMHPILGAFVSDAFYKPHNEAFGSAEGAAENPAFDHSLGGQYEGRLAVWKDIPFSSGAEERARYSWRRRSEANWIAKETRRILEEAPGLSVGVISFYSAQVDAIMNAMQQVGLTAFTDEGDRVIADAWRTTSNAHGEPCERLRVGTVDAFQGKEFDIVILSLTRSNRLSAADEKAKRRKFGHLLLENRLCVAMSRQKRLLTVVGDAAMATPELPGLHEFMKLCGGKHGTILRY